MYLLVILNHDLNKAKILSTQCKMIWKKIENLLGESLPICIKKVLIFSGYDTLSSLQSISPDSITRIENYMDQNGENIIQGLDCCYHDSYKEQKKFKFLPGHYDFLLILSKNITHYITNERTCLKQAVEHNLGLSVIMKELIYTSLRNETVDKNNAQYSDIVRNFAIYIFILCGRSCYEVLYENLPIPSISTICK